MNFDIGITTAQREKPTLIRTLQDLRELGVCGDIFIFSERGNRVPGVVRRADRSVILSDVDDTNVWWIENTRMKGVVVNSYWGLRQLVNRRSGRPILFLQDDVQLCRTALERIAEKLKTTGVLLGFTHEWLVAGYHPYLRQCDEGWTRLKIDEELGANIHGGLCYAFRPDELKLILDSHCMATYLTKIAFKEFPNMHWDNILAASVVSVGLPIYVHMPSLVEHTGEVSAVYSGNSKKTLEGRRGYGWSAEY